VLPLHIYNLIYLNTGPGEFYMRCKTSETSPDDMNKCYLSQRNQRKFATVFSAKGLCQESCLPWICVYFHVFYLTGTIIEKYRCYLCIQEYNVKLSDFGLAKDGPVGDKSHVSTRIMGTYGYAAPEYIMTGKALSANSRPSHFYY